MRSNNFLGIYTVQIKIYLQKKYCNFISTQHVTREHGSTIRKLSFSLITQLLTKINKVIFVWAKRIRNNIFTLPCLKYLFSGCSLQRCVDVVAFALIPGNFYQYKGNNSYNRKSWKICSKITIKTENDVSDVLLYTFF